jgi:hypothetical protein
VLVEIFQIALMMTLLVMSLEMMMMKTALQAMQRPPEEDKDFQGGYDATIFII